MKVSFSSTGRVLSPITLEEIKDHLQIERGETGSDEVLKGLRAASVEMAQNITGRKLMSQKWDVYFDDWPAGNDIELPFSPLVSVAATGITYTGSTSNTMTLGSTSWAVDTVSEPPRIVIDNTVNGWPTDELHYNNPIRIVGTYGYSASSDIPQSLKHAMLLMIGHWYENREETITGVGLSMQEIPLGAQSLLEMYRTKWF